MTTYNRHALPLGTSSFSMLRSSGQIYVDKTALIFELASLRQKFFLTRPRRFGKSLLVSTLASLFQDGLKDFAGLAIEKLWKDTTYNVIKLDFSKAKNFSTLEEFKASLRLVIVRSFAMSGFVFDRSLESEWMGQISDWLATQPNGSLVLLIDEYDAPLTACLDNEELFQAVRVQLANFYSVIKSNDACWRFMFMTGIAKFNQTGIFSELNIFTDISLKPAYGSLLGYTDEDIDLYFGEYVKHAAQNCGLSTTEIRRLLRENYDGYCFDKKVSQHVYAPWSVLNFFNSPEDGFENYWMESGGNLSLLQKYLHTHSLKSPAEYGAEQMVSYNSLSCSTDLTNINDLVLLTQAGYLTIKRRQGQTLFVSYPNKEVADSMATLYTDMLLRDRTLEAVGAGNLQQAILTGNMTQLFESANRAFAAIDYERYPIETEKHCQAFLQVFIAGAGYNVTAERHSALGRSDLELDSKSCHWVLEIKFQRRGESAQALLAKAAEQITEKQYGATADKPLFRVAAVFSEEKRQFVCWKQAV